MTDYVRNAAGCILFFCPVCCLHATGNYCIQCGSRTRYAKRTDIELTIDRIKRCAKKESK